VRIGVVSDTHGYFDPRLPVILEGVDEILHAGDVGSEAVLDQLRAIAPVHAVVGNIDSPALGLAPTVTRHFGPIHVHMLHQLAKPQTVLRDWARNDGREGKPDDECRRFLQDLPEQCQVVIFGHSHDPCGIVLAGKLFFNPGSAGKTRFSLPRCFGNLEVSAGGVRATFHGLGRYNKVMPEDVWLPVGGAKAWGSF
jgi:putative phosphoesterase